jgi:hypothetical protein
MGKKNHQIRNYASNFMSKTSVFSASVKASGWGAKASVSYSQSRSQSEKIEQDY